MISRMIILFLSIIIFFLTFITNNTLIKFENYYFFSILKYNEAYVNKIAYLKLYFKILSRLSYNLHTANISIYLVCFVYSFNIKSLPINFLINCYIVLIMNLFIQIIFSSPRPFWNYDFQLINIQECQFDFTTPDNVTFCCFFIPMIYYYYKYRLKLKKININVYNNNNYNNNLSIKYSNSNLFDYNSEPIKYDSIIQKSLRYKFSKFILKKLFVLLVFLTISILLNVVEVINFQIYLYQILSSLVIHLIYLVIIINNKIVKNLSYSFLIRNSKFLRKIKFICVCFVFVFYLVSIILNQNFLTKDATSKLVYSLNSIILCNNFIHLYGFTMQIVDFSASIGIIGVLYGLRFKKYNKKHKFKTSNKSGCQYVIIKIFFYCLLISLFILYIYINDINLINSKSTMTLFFYNSLIVFIFCYLMSFINTKFLN